MPSADVGSGLASLAASPDRGRRLVSPVRASLCLFLRACPSVRPCSFLRARLSVRLCLFLRYWVEKQMRWPPPRRQVLPRGATLVVRTCRLVFADVCVFLSGTSLIIQQQPTCYRASGSLTRRLSQTTRAVPRRTPSCFLFAHPSFFESEQPLVFFCHSLLILCDRHCGRRRVPRERS